MTTIIEQLNHIQRKVQVTKSKNNPSGNFQYRTCDDILQAAKPHLGTKYAILLTDKVLSIDGKLYMRATATLRGPEGKISTQGYAAIAEKIMSMSAPQLTGTSSTYARKTALSGLLMLDDNPDIDSRNQYAEEVEEFAKLISDDNAFGLYYFTQQLEPEAWQGVWAVYKGEHIPKGEIGVYRERIKQLNEAGRAEALNAQTCFDSEEAGISEEALAEYSTDEQAFIRGLS